MVLWHSKMVSLITVTRTSVNSFPGFSPSCPPEHREGENLGERGWQWTLISNWIGKNLHLIHFTCPLTLRKRGEVKQKLMCFTKGRVLIIWIWLLFIHFTSLSSLKWRDALPGALLSVLRATRTVYGSILRSIKMTLGAARQKKSRKYVI